MSTTVTTQVKTDAVAAMKAAPALLAEAQALNPAAAQAVESKALLASKTPWGTLAVTAVSYTAAKYGFGWDETTCELVAGAGVLLGSFLMRSITSAKITGLFSKAPVATTATPPAAPAAGT